MSPRFVTPLRYLLAKQAKAGVPRELRGLPQDERNRDYGLERLAILEERKGINRGF